MTKLYSSIGTTVILLSIVCIQGCKQQQPLPQSAEKRIIDSTLVQLHTKSGLNDVNASDLRVNGWIVPSGIEGQVYEVTLPKYISFPPFHYVFLVKNDSISLLSGPRWGLNNDALMHMFDLGTIDRLDSSKLLDIFHFLVRVMDFTGESLIRPVQSPEEIPGITIEQLDSIKSLFTEYPKFEKNKDQRRMILFIWNAYGGGLYKAELALDGQKVSFDYHLLRKSLGDWLDHL